MKTPDYRSKNDILRLQRWDLLIGDPNMAAATVQELRLVLAIKSNLMMSYYLLTVKMYL